MANKEHLKLIKEALQKKDILVWNIWRDKNPNVLPDLSQINLILPDLREANFWRADLSRAYLRRVNLSYANFWNANLGEAYLSGVDLSGTNLSEANLGRADLRNAKGLEHSQIRSALNWGTAYYSQGILESLGLPPNHNEELQKKPNNCLNKSNREND